ncbi:hypothetical protein [Streptomyces sp. H27-H5]|uniref:hypothetical protein n=1 Tax=Streptomyces sp. H27-H5 TaxID=2996460 RepID=UPI002270CBAF|nr:hypothetical protein [Streptomyces sp. H27-H5]MCY0963288.1 hypothetical protein [Streptomyces sp. H27-H5]
MSVSTSAPPSPPEDFALFIKGLACARELTSLSEAARTWDALDLATGPPAPPTDEVPALVTELQGILHTLGGCAPRLLAIHRKAVESGQGEETAMEDALLCAEGLLRNSTATRTELGYLRLLAACAQTIFDLAGDTP